MKYIIGIFLASIMAVNAGKIDPLLELSTLNYFFYSKAIKSWDVFEGIVLGLQQNPNNTQHQCYLSFELIKDNIQKMPDYISAISNSSSSENSIATTLTNNPWYQPNTYFKLLKRGQEFTTMYFSFYDKCYLDDLMIAQGRTMNSFSGALNTITTLAIYLYNLATTFDDIENDITKMLSIT